jgi:putative transcriptional regulator
VTRTAGQLLVAEPMLGDPNFDRTVVLVVEHSADGAMGLVLNRPTTIAVVDVLPAWAPIVADPAVLHVGGPVEEQSGWCLARVSDPAPRPGYVPVLGDVGLVDLDADPLDAVGSIRRARLFAGYSGWGPGQLERELAGDAWFVVAAEPDDPFLTDGATLWSRILARQGGPLSRLALFPPDPSMN